MNKSNDSDIQDNNNLNKRISEQLKNNKYIKSVSFYGSIENKNEDEFSDIDITINIKKPDKFYKDFKKIISSIGDYYVIFPMLIERKLQVFSIIFKRYPLYKKLDLRVNVSTSVKDLGNIIEHKVSSFDFYNQFIGAIRFVKYRRRRELTPSMKFYRSFHESLVKIADNSKLVQKYYFIKNYKNIDSNYIDMLKIYIKYMVKLKVFTLNSLESQFGKDVIKFAQNELFRKGDTGNS